MVESRIALCSELSVTREALAALPTPEPKGSRHFPIPHIELVRSLDAALEAEGLELVEERLGTNPNGLRLFGACRIRPVNGKLTDYTRDGQDFALGYRSGNDQSIRITFVAGVAVFVCSNLELHGDEVVLARKHTVGLADGALAEEVIGGIGRYVEQQKGYVVLQDKAKAKELGEDRAKCLIYDAFAANILPGSAFPNVHRNFFSPEDDWTDCHGRTLHALHSAFTRELRGRKPERLFEGTQALGRLVKAELN